MNNQLRNKRSVEFLSSIKRRTKIRTRCRVLIKKIKVAGFLLRNAGLRELLNQIRLVVVKKISVGFNCTPNIVGDVLFISINEPLLDRYRTDHMIEKLKSVNVVTSKIFYYELKVEHVKHFNTFIFYRCPWVPEFEDFFKEAKRRNKSTIYAVDDLVIDRKYTDNIPTVKTMSGKDLEIYNDGVMRHKKVMEHCDYAITTTDQLKKELLNYKNLKDVFIDRNIASNEMVYCSEKAIKEVQKDRSKIVIGYFSGTSTHNEDFKMIAPALTRILDEYPDAYIKLMGRVDPPNELGGYEKQIIYAPYVDWRELPTEMRKVDIVLAPLVDTIFNRAKSENKWLEASLTQTPTIASNIGAFKQVIEDGKTGLLVGNTTSEWYEGIKKLIDDSGLREKIAINARNYVLESYRTFGKSANKLKSFIEDITPEVIAFAGVSLADISGGNIVIKKHMDILQKQGKIVYGVETMGYVENDKWLSANRDDDNKYDIFRIGSMRRQDSINLRMSFDKFVATYWSSNGIVDVYQYMRNKDSKKLYLVQGMEAEFFQGDDSEKVQVYSTYSNDRIQPITISKWCQNWLKDIFGRESKYAPNGIDLINFKFKKRNWQNRKVRILIEGNSQNDCKRVDESFKITNKLDKNKFEISYLSYSGKPKDWYRVDHSYNAIAPDKVGKIYEKNDILVKSSVLESFSYPPLEMMATGGVPVLVQNGGNSEYLKNNENAIFYEEHNINDAVAKIQKLVSDPSKFAKIAKAGRRTAESRNWDIISDGVVKLYE